MIKEPFDLVVKAETKVSTQNIEEFEQKANAFIAGLTSKFETDNDFAQAEEDISNLKTLEERTKTAINAIVAGNADLTKIISTAEAIVERFRQERLMREKLVKTRKEEIKNGYTQTAIDEIFSTMDKYTSADPILKSVFNRSFTKEEVINRINECKKGKRTLDGLEKAINAEKLAINAEIAKTVAKLLERKSMIPTSHAHLFSDAVELISSDCDLQSVITERLEADKKRKEEEAKQTQVAVSTSPAPVVNVQKQETENPFPPEEQIKKEVEEDDGEVFNFILQVPFKGTISQARAYFAPVKALNMQGVKLMKYSA